MASEPPPWPLVPIEAKDAVPGDVTPARNEVAPPPGQPGPGFQPTRVPRCCPRRSGLRARRKTSAEHVSASGSSPEAPGPGSPWSGAGKKEAEEVFEYCAVKGTVLQRGGCAIRAGLLRDPLALSCDPHTTFSDSWSPSVGCACRSELAHWRGPGNALISLVQMRPGIS